MDGMRGSPATTKRKNGSKPKKTNNEEGDGAVSDDDEHGSSLFPVAPLEVFVVKLCSEENGGGK